MTKQRFIRLIRDNTARHYNVSLRAIIEPRHDQRARLARYASMWLARRLLGATFQQIGTEYGCDDQAAQYARQVMEDAVAQSADLKRSLGELEASLQAELSRLSLDEAAISQPCRQALATFIEARRVLDNSIHGRGERWARNNYEIAAANLARIFLTHQ